MSLITASNKYMFKLFLLIVIAFTNFSCTLLKECSEENIANITSPDGKYVAALFIRNCGATTPFVYHVNLRASSEKFTANLSGTIYDGEVFDINNRKVNLVWKDAQTLFIECKDCPANEPIILENSWKDINIFFQTS